MNINLNLYKYFYEVANHGSYTKAAEFLMISQPSLSYSIKVLENQLNKKLFIRNTRGISLTKYGKILYEKLDVVFKQLKNIIDDEGAICGKVILGVRSAFAYNILPFYINEICKIYSELQIDFVVANSEKMTSLLDNEDVDIIIDEYSYENEYISIETGKSYESVFFTTKDNFKYVNNANLDFLKSTNTSICIVEKNRISKEIEKKNSNFKYIKVQSTPIMLDKVKRENIIGISPLAIIKDEIERGELVKLDTNIELPKLKLYITYKKGVRDKRNEAIIDFFKEHFGGYQNS